MIAPPHPAVAPIGTAATGLVIAHASAATQEAGVALQTLQLPQLERLLAELAPTQCWGDDEYNLSATHEQVLASDLGWTGDAGRWPLAAHLARTDGLLDDLAPAATPGDSRPWGLVTPCHWLVGNDKMSLVDPQALALDAAESRALFDALQPSFEAAGWTLQWGAPLRWYARHAVLGSLQTASLDRVIGRNLDLWLRGGDPLARPLRRLQVEAQMLWHGHAVNAARADRGALAVNSFWLSGSGHAQAACPPADALALPTLDESLRAPLLAGDWAAWCAAWQALDAGPIAALLARARAGQAVSLTLCGERQARRYERPPATLARRLARLLPGPRRADARAVLTDL